MASDRRLIREIARIAKQELGKQTEVSVDTTADAVKHYPERWRVEGFPNGDELARLRA